MNLLNSLLVDLPAVLLCITFHEFSHGYIAYLLGDQTARRAGRLTLNPIHHIDPVGFICMLFFRFGWAKPVPINVYNFKNQKLGIFLVSAAGPLSNIFLAFILVLAIRLLSYLGQSAALALSSFLATAARLSIGLAVFNLLPIPPLDGSKMLLPLLPAGIMGTVLEYERYSIILLVLLLYFGLLNVPLNFAFGVIWNGIIRASAIVLLPFGV